MYLGSWKIDDYLTFPANLHDPTSGGESDADSAPTYRVYEDETGTAVATGTLTVLDGSNTTGFYTERLQLTTGAGFESGKAYTVFMRGIVGGVAATMSHTFQIGAEVRMRVALPDSVPADGSYPTLEQAMYMTVQFLMERVTSGTSVLVKKPDGSTTLLTLTTNDATSPTSISRTA